MLSSRRAKQILAVAAVAALANVASANITIQFTTYNLGGSAGSDALAANGWIGVLLTASSDANPIGGFDLDTGSRGITGTFEQYTAIVGASTFPTITGATPTTPAASTVDQIDSFFSTFTGLGFTASVALAEDNNGSSHAASPLQNVSHDYTFSPLLDDANHDYGIGSRMHGAGAFTTGQTTSVPLAFVIVPVGSTVHVVGQFADSSTQLSNGFLVDQSFVAVPEPASLGLLAAGGLALLVRRRRRE